MNFEKREFEKRDKELVLIASENYPSEEILEASGSIFQLKYAEGFPYKRYYQGTEVVDDMEQECINKCLELFGCDETYKANVQPNSGASANMIVYNAVLNPQDTVLAMDVKAGGHISHSHPKSYLAKYHNVIPYNVDDKGFLNYDEIEELALKHKPKLIVCGASNYSREIDFKRFKDIADKVGAYLMCDMAHISILVAHGLHQSPVGIADFITFTTHKCLAGPRGGCIIYKGDFDKQIRLSTIPSLFGGPLEHQIYAKLVCFNEALTNNSREYSKQIIKNAKVMAETFKHNNIPIVTDDTENHLMTVDLTDFYLSGKGLAEILEECGVICNCNTVPNDKRSFMETSGVRLGVPAITKRGLNESETRLLTQNISDLINNFRKHKYEITDLNDLKDRLKKCVTLLTSMHSLKEIYPNTVERLGIEKWLV